MMPITDAGFDVGYRFGNYEIDLRTVELRHHGVSTRVEPKVWDLLVYLLVHRDRVVTKPELFRAIWQDTTVCEGALQQCVSVLRRALGDTGRSQSLLRTYPRVGYRFVGPVEVLKDERARVGPTAAWWQAVKRPAVPQPATTQ